MDKNKRASTRRESERRSEHRRKSHRRKVNIVVDFEKRNSVDLRGSYQRKGNRREKERRN